MTENDDNSHLSSYQMDLFILKKDLQDYIDDSIVNKPKTKQKKKKAKPNSSWKIEEMRNSNGDITPLGWKRVEELTKIVLRKHFPSISIYKDLIQLGIVKAGMVLSIDPENGVYTSLRTYLYTCIRNEISNYLYHTHKRTKESSDGLLFCKTRFKQYSIDNKYVEIVFNKLSKKYIKYKEFISDIISILSDSDNFNNDKYFLEELKKRKNKLGINISDYDLKEHIFDLLSPIEKQLLILIVYEIKKD